MRELKEAIGVEPSYTGQDSRIRLAIESASQLIENQLGRKLAYQSHVDYLSTKRNYSTGYDVYGIGASGRTSSIKSIPLYLRNYPVDETQPFEVYYDPMGVFDASHKLDPSEYILDAERGMLILKRGVGAFKRSLKIVYTAGLPLSVDTYGGVVEDPDQVQEKTVSNALPPDLRQAIIWQAQHTYDKQYSGNLNVRESRGEGSSNTTRFSNIAGITPEAMAIVVQNRRPRHSVV